MNWKIGFIMWWKGLLVMAVPCVPFLMLGLGVLFAASLISWPAIFFYGGWLWVCKRFRFPLGITIITTIFIAAPAAIICALWLFYYVLDDITAYPFSISDIEFFGPLLCCAFSVFLSAKGIRLYLNPEENVIAFTID